MDGELAEKIKSFLSDPSAAEKIAAVAQTLGVQPSEPPKAQPAVTAEVPSAPLSAVPTVTGRNRHAQLISALKPLIREDKRPKLDSLERAMTMATLFSGIRKGQKS